LVLLFTKISLLIVVSRVVKLNGIQ